MGAEHTALVRTAWAKSWPMDQMPTAWLPLWQHLDDAADVAGLLWDSWLSPSSRRLIATAFPDGEDDGRRFVRWLAGVHDVGKVSPAFASQVPRLRDAMRNAGFQFPYAERIRGHRHEDISASALADWLRGFGFDGFSSGQFACIVLAHHGLFKSVTPNLSDHVVDVGDGEWDLARIALLNRSADRTEASGRLPDWRRVRLPGPAQMITSAVIVMADWIASSDVFPLVDIEDVPELPPGTPEESLRAKRSFTKVDLGGIWDPAPPDDARDLIVHRFPSIETPRAVQTELVRAAGNPQGTGLLLLEAPMGIGKTEAALAAAEVLAMRFGCRGVFIALPTRATTDAMFSRVHEWLNHIPASEASGTLPLALVHGKAAFNQEYLDLRFGPAHHEAIYDGEECAGIGVAEWMSGRKRAALSSFVVGTIDHVLFAALKAKHVMLRQLSLAGKVVILDEIHAADPFMSVYLTRALEWMGALGVPVILMTATLPGRMRTDLYHAYSKGAARRDPRIVDTAPDLGHTMGYPAIIASTPMGPDVTNPRSDHFRHAVRLRSLDDSTSDLVALLRERLAEGGCAVVIRNTVGRAQETAAVLEQQFGIDNVTVTHSGFLAVDRAEKDRTLLRRFGPPGADVTRPELHIVVGTQVVEQSLDIDFDIMVTDVAPIDLVMQRIGRLHRHRRDRPARLRHPECYMTGVDWSLRPPEPHRGCLAVYRRYRLLACLAVLDPYLTDKPLAIPDDVPGLVHDAYSQDLKPPGGWQRVWGEAWAAEVKHVTAQQDKAGTFCLPGVMSPGKSLEGLTNANLGNVDEDGHKTRAAVRDGEDALQVVVLEHRDGMDRIPSWVPSDDPVLPIRDIPPSWEQSRLLAQCTLNLPTRLTRPSMIDVVIKDLERHYFGGWRSSAYLRDELALVLNEQLESEIAGHLVRYDRRKGLTVTKLNEAHQ